jgi:hypothetical protein
MRVKERKKERKKESYRRRMVEKNESIKTNKRKKAKNRNANKQ